MILRYIKLYMMFVAIMGIYGLHGCAPLINFNDDCDVHRKDFVALDLHYALPGDQVDVTLVGTAITVDTMGLIFLTTPAGGDSVTVTTSRTVPLNPGDETYALFAAEFIFGDTIQWVGLFDTANGIAVGYSGPGSDFSILYRNDSVDTIVPQASFNVDPLDGTGPSGFTLVPTNLNSFRLSYAWYGTNIIRYQLLGSNGEWITFHEISNINTQTTAAFSNPYLPMTAQQTNTTGSASVDQIGTNAWRAGVIHSGDNNAGIRTFDMQQVVPIVAAAGEAYMFTIRNKTTFGGETNRVLVRLSRVGGGNGLDATTPVVVRYYKNATLTGAVFTDVNTANSVVEVDTSATTFSGGHLLWMIGKAGLVFEETPKDEIEFFLGPGESITVTAENMVSASLSLYAAATWEELQ